MIDILLIKGDTDLDILVNVVEKVNELIESHNQLEENLFNLARSVWGKTTNENLLTLLKSFNL